MAFLRRFGGVI